MAAKSKCRDLSEKWEKMPAENRSIEQHPLQIDWSQAKPSAEIAVWTASRLGLLFSQAPMVERFIINVTTYPRTARRTSICKAKMAKDRRILNSKSSQETHSPSHILSRCDNDLPYIKKKIDRCIWPHAKFLDGQKRSRRNLRSPSRCSSSSVRAAKTPLS